MGWIVGCFCCCAVLGQAPNRSLSQEIDFARHLSKKGLHNDAIFQLNRIRNQYSLSTPGLDSLNYFTGWSLYEIKSLDSGVHYFGQVSANSGFYHEAGFFASISEVTLGNYGAATRRLMGLENLDQLSFGTEFRDFQLAGIALLQADYAGFDSLATGFTKSYYQFAREEEDLMNISLELRSIKNRKMWKAGMLSAVAPGAGKMYAGKTKEGVVAMMQVLALGAVAYEQYRRYGVSDPRFILFGGVFTVFYVGNIWGSALSVKIKRDEQLYDLHERILLDLHIPVRTLFN
ncbi:MAG: hypothetical protein ACFB10_01855 [Salibacteraceae bacterium]